MQDGEFEWDDEKARTNLAKHKVDFWEATLVFDDPGVVDDPDETMDYGEERYRALGMVNERLIAVIYVQRGKRKRLITARTASHKERKVYAEQNP